MVKRNALPSLSVLQSFDAAARHQSFTSGAEELGVTQGAVSRQVRELEAIIGTRLFKRVGRAVQLTRAGNALSSSLSCDLERMRQTLSRAVLAGEGALILTIAVLPTFGARWLIPRLPDFHARNPDIQLNFISRSEPFNLVEARCDMAIHFGRADWPGAQLAPLCPENLVAVATPDFLSRYQINRPQDLFDAPLLHLASRPDAWAHFQRALSAEPSRISPGIQFDQFSMIISAALSGLGVGLLPSYLIESEIAAGTLAIVCEVPSDTRDSYFMVTPLGETSPEASHFVAWIRRQVSRRPSLSSR